jgi:TRAP transporter TAXI family solute receptor
MTSSSPVASRRRSRLFLTMGVASTIVLTACGGGDSGGDSAGGGGDKASEPRNENLTFATGGTGGVYYPYGGGIANVLSSKLPGVVVTVQETNASVDNMKLLESNQAQLALGLGDVVSDAANGEHDFSSGKLDICSLGNLYNNYVHAFSTKDTGIKTVEDMKGKRVSVGATGSASEVTADRIMEAAGLDPKKDITRVQLGVAETVDALKDGTVDAGFWSGGLPTGAIVDLASTGKLQLIDTGEYADAMAKEYGDFYFAADIPAKTYQGQTKKSSNVVSPNILVVRTDMDESLQEDITKTIFENKKQLITVHPAAKELDPKTAGDVGFIKTCPGAKKYFDSAN